jgi:hypothetical protein
MKRRQHNPKLAIGSRIRLSTLGIERCSKLKVRTGVVVGINPSGTSFRVLIDGRKLPRTLHESYIEPEEEVQPTRCGPVAHEALQSEVRGRAYRV